MKRNQKREKSEESKENIIKTDDERRVFYLYADPRLNKRQIAKQLKMNYTNVVRVI